VSNYEKFDEFLMPVMRHAAPDDRAMENVERSEQGRRAIAFVVMRHGSAFSGLQRQPGLCAVESLDLAFLVDRDDDGMSGRIHIEADNVFDLGGELGIVGPLEGAQAMRLEPMRLPNALDRLERNPDGFRHCSPRPVGDCAGRVGASQSDDPRHHSWGDQRGSGLAGFVTKQAIYAFFSETPLPTPDRWTADAGAPRHFKHRQSFAGEKHDFGAQHMFEGTIAITHDLPKAVAVGRVQKDADCLGHDHRLARFSDFVNPMSVSMH
jgi:hypothetical protein